MIVLAATAIFIQEFLISGLIILNDSYSFLPAKQITLSTNYLR